jgi:hypothetical protein
MGVSRRCSEMHQPATLVLHPIVMDAGATLGASGVVGAARGVAEISEAGDEEVAKGQAV